jgi:DNA helicase-2/ATP-dependent DNA helicase PcrA
VTTNSMLDRLNQFQRVAAEHRDGPAVVFAGAGSGKTRIITTRIAWLISEGVSPWQILALTFTNKAAGEMRDRVLSLCPVADKALVTTFHSACARWLREFAPELGFTSDFTIYDDSDQKSVIKKIMSRGNIQLDKDTSVAEFRTAINHAKTLGLFPSDRESQKSQFRTFMPVGGVDVYAAFQETLALANAMDFGDLIMNMLLLLKTNERVCRLMQDRYQYILVDEYQDTNRPQIELLKIIAGKHQNLFVVGDDDQSIYSWRGAVPANIIDFDQTYPNVRVCKLEQNYRCTSTIVDAAAALVANNITRADKTLRTDNPKGELIDFRYETDGEFEAWWVAETIKKESTKFPYDEVAIFYRTNSQSRILEDALRKERIPYRIYGSLRFYERAEIKDVMAYIKIIVNPRDDVSLFRALNTPPRGLGAVAEDAILACSRDHQLSAYEATRKLAQDGVPRLSSKLAGFVDLMENLKLSMTSLALPDFLELLIEQINYFGFLAKKFPDQSDDKQDNVMELVTAIAEFVATNPSLTLADWLQEIMLASEANGDVNGVNMMTLHMAKGLEFERVFLVGVEDGLLPHFNSCDDVKSVEEERRLLYVGMTRAKKKLSISAAYMRRTWGQAQANPVSRFLREIPSHFVNILTPPGGESPFVDGTEVTKNGSAKKSSQQYDNSDESDDSSEMLEGPIVAGSPVTHPTYGIGNVEEIETNFGRPKVLVRFRDVGLRRVEAHHLSRGHDYF